MSLLGRLLMTCFGLGYLRPAPGTWGSLPPVVVSLILVIVLGSGNDSNQHIKPIVVNAALVVIGMVFSIGCLKFGAAAESLLGRKDPSSVVADEVAGQCIALLLLPWQWSDDFRSIERNVFLASAAFLAFRLFDIAKPPPARNLQRLAGGLGILVDDLIAGFYAMIAVQLLAHFIRFPT